MNKSKFQLEEEKKQSILNCINSITGDLTESVISAPGVDLIGSMRMLKTTTDSSDNSNFAKQKVKSLIDPKLSLSTDNKQKYPFVARPPFMLQTQINSNLNNSRPSFSSKASDNPYMSANPEEDKDFVGPPSSLIDPEQDKDFVGPPSSLMNTSSTRPESPENTAAEIVNGNNQVGSPNISGTKPAEWRGRNGMTVDELNADSNRIKSDMQNRGEPTSVGSSEWVDWKRKHAPTGVYDPTTVTRSTIDQDNSKLAADRQRGVARTGDRYQGTPGVGSFEQANRGKVGLDVGMNPDNSPEAVKKRTEEGLGRLRTTGWTQDSAGKWINPEQSMAQALDSASKLPKKDSIQDDSAATNYEQDYLNQRASAIETWDSDKEQRAINAREREATFQSDALKKLQDRTALTKARKELEVEQSRKTNTSSSGSSRTVTEQAENTGAGGGSGNLGTSGDTSGDTSGITMGKEEKNQWQTSINNLKQLKMPNIQDSMIAATKFAGKVGLSAVATPPENYVNTAMGALGQLGFDQQNAEDHTRHYQNLLNVIPTTLTKLGIPGAATAGNLIEPQTRNAAKLMTRMFLDPRAVTKGQRFKYKEIAGNTDSEEETDNSVPVSSNKPAPKQLTSKP